MTPNKLPPLPEPEFIRPDRPFKIFTADQMRAYGKLCSAEAFQLYVDANEARIDAEKAIRQSQSLPAGAVAWRVEWTADDEGDAGFVTLDRESGARNREQEAIAEGFQGVVVRPLVYAALQADAREKGEAVPAAWLYEFPFDPAEGTDHSLSPIRVLESWVSHKGATETALYRADVVTALRREIELLASVADKFRLANKDLERKLDLATQPAQASEKDGKPVGAEAVAYLARSVVSHLDDGSLDTSRLPDGMGDDLRSLRAELDKANAGYTHPQPVTPAGGEVVAYRYVADEGVYNPFVRDWLDGSPDQLDLENIARHPGVRFEFAYSNQPVPDHELQQKWFRRGWDMYVELHGETHPHVADAALPRGHSISDAKQALGVDESLNIEALRGLLRTYEKCPATGQREATALRAAIAALGQPCSPLVERVHIASPNDLDPITAYLEDHGGGKGRLTISCYGDAWTGYWGAMGCGLREFLAGCDPSYVTGNLLALRKSTVRERAYVADIAKELIAALNQRGGGDRG